MSISMYKSEKWKLFVKQLTIRVPKKREELESFVEFAKRNGLEEKITKDKLDPRTELVLKNEVVQEEINISRTSGKEVVIGSGFVVASGFGFFNPVEDGEGHIKVDWAVV